MTEKKCVDCYYSKPSKNYKLVVCTYMDDILSNGNILDTGTEWSSARYFAKLTNLKSNVYEAYDMDNVLRVCVEKSGKCGKWVEVKKNGF